MSSKKLRMWSGNHPDEKSWNRVFDLGKFDGVNWVLYEKVSDVDSVWKNYKLVADGMVLGIANYRLAWNGERFADHPDVQTLNEFRPTLGKAVFQVLGEVIA
jgi:hypothetical protein